MCHCLHHLPNALRPESRHRILSPHPQNDHTLELRIDFRLMIWLPRFLVPQHNKRHHLQRTVTPHHTLPIFCPVHKLLKLPQ